MISLSSIKPVIEIASGIIFIEPDKLENNQELANYSAQMDTMTEIARSTFASEDGGRPEDSKTKVGQYICFGMPGTGKNWMVKQSAWSLRDRYGIKASYLEISCNTLIQIAKSVSVIRGYLARATARVERRLPAIIVFDELDALAVEKVQLGGIENRFALEVAALIKNRFNVHGVNGKLLFVGVTNYPGDIDGAVKTLLGSPLYLPLPTEDCFVQMLSKKKFPQPEEVGKEFVHEYLLPNYMCPRSFARGCEEAKKQYGATLARKTPKDIAECIFSLSGLPYAPAEVDRYEEINEPYIRQSEGMTLHRKRP
jgi:hypothetical protein